MLNDTELKHKQAEEKRNREFDDFLHKDQTKFLMSLIPPSDNPDTLRTSLRAAFDAGYGAGIGEMVGMIVGSLKNKEPR